MRPSSRAGRFGLLLGLIWLAMAAHALWSEATAARRHAPSRELVQALHLTDPAWATEARYTRHPNLADLHTPFQDGPGLPDHFPSGSVMPRPDHWPPAGTARAPASGD